MSKASKPRGGMSVLIHTDTRGRRFAFVGNYTIREQADGMFSVTLDCDGDDVRVAAGVTFDAAVWMVTG